MFCSVISGETNHKRAANINVLYIIYFWAHFSLVGQALENKLKNYLDCPNSENFPSWLIN